MLPLTPQQKRLQKAIESEDITKVKKLLESGVLPVMGEGVRNGSLHLAMGGESTAELIHLIMPHLKVNDDLSKLKHTALSLLALNTRVDQRYCMEALLESGESPNFKSDGGITPMHQVAAMGTLEGCRTLIDFGAFVDARDDGGVTPLGKCLRSIRAINLLNLNSGYEVKERVEIARLLIQHGATTEGSGTGDGIEEDTMHMGCIRNGLLELLD